MIYIVIIILLYLGAFILLIDLFLIGYKLIFDDKENYISYYSSLKNGSELKSNYKIIYIKDDTCPYCMMYDRSFSDQLSFLKSLRMDPAVEVYNVNNLSYVPRSYDTIIRSFRNQRTTPFVCVVKDFDYDRPLVLDEYNRDDLYMYLHSWEQYDQQVKYTYGPALCNELKTIMRRAPRQPVLMNPPIPKQYRTYYKRRTRGHYRYRPRNRRVFY
jgi:hypothetical protein